MLYSDIYKTMPHSLRLHQALYMAVQSGIGDSRKKKTTDEIIVRNKRLREVYNKKREKG